MNNSMPHTGTGDSDFAVHHGDCREILPTIPTASIDAVVTDPPYPCVKREYGYWTEDVWQVLMGEVVPEIRRVLKPQGSAMFVLQPNMERLGRMRMWLWDFVSMWGREWNLVQDAYAWNYTTMPGVDAQSTLMRSSVKWCVWFGSPDCYRNQLAVLWSPSQASVAKAAAYRASGVRSTARKRRPSGRSVNDAKATLAHVRRGGVTPYNMLPIAGRPAQRGRSNTHGAQTPPALSNWWIRYICPPGGVVLDPFAGVASIGVEALRLGRRYIGIEVKRHHFLAGRERLARITGESAGAAAGGGEGRQATGAPA